MPTVSGEFEFACPACGEQARVDAAVRQVMLDDGCIMCGTPVGESAFTSVSESATHG